MAIVIHHKVRHKRNKPTKKRSVAFVGQTAGVVDRLTFIQDEVTGQFRIEELDPKSLRIEHFYERDSGKDKVLLSAPATIADTGFSYIETLRRDYDYLVAVDTNTRELRSSRVSVCVACMAPLSRPHSGQIPCEPFAAYIFLDAAADINPERIGWHLIIQNHILRAQAVQRRRVGIVVDSELGAVPRINARTEPYYSSFQLPQYTGLVYASDAAVDTLPNHMIRYCDNGGEKVFDELSKRAIDFRFKKNGDQHFHSYAPVEIRIKGKS